MFFPCWGIIIINVTRLMFRDVDDEVSVYRSLFLFKYFTSGVDFYDCVIRLLALFYFGFE